jgi:hypothetical protein
MRVLPSISLAIAFILAAFLPASVSAALLNLPSQFVCFGSIEDCLSIAPDAEIVDLKDIPAIFKFDSIFVPKPNPIFVQKNRFQEAVRLLDGQAFHASIDRVNEKDLYVFTPSTRNGMYSFQTFGRLPDGSIMPSRGRLYDQNKTLLTTFELTQNVSGVNDGHFYGHYRLSAGSSYYLEVTHAYEGVGSYDVLIKGPTYTNDKDDFGNDPVSGYVLSEKELVKGQIEVKQDEDYFVFTPATDGEYVVELGATNMFQATIMSNTYWLDSMSGMNYRRIVNLRAGVPVQIRVININSSFVEGNNPYTIRIFNKSLLGTI